MFPVHPNQICNLCNSGGIVEATAWREAERYWIPKPWWFSGAPGEYGEHVRYLNNGVLSGVTKLTRSDAGRLGQVRWERLDWSGTGNMEKMECCRVWAYVGETAGRNSLGRLGSLHNDLYCLPYRNFRRVVTAVVCCQCLSSAKVDTVR